METSRASGERQRGKGGGGFTQPDSQTVLFGRIPLTTAVEQGWEGGGQEYIYGRHTGDAKKTREVWGEESEGG